MVGAGFAGERRAARHRADRKPARAVVEDGGRADPVFRRRQGRPEGGVARRRPGAAASQARQEPALCAAAGRPGPRRSRALRRTRRDRGSDRRGARARRRDLVARNRRRHVSRRRSGARRWRRGSANSPTASATKWCGAIIARIWPQRLQRTFAPEAARGGYGRGNYRGGGRQFGGESGRRFAPRGSFTPGAAGRFEPRSAAAAGRPRPAARPSTAGPIRWRAPSLRRARSCAASAARSPAARR